ncbi:hypothetical protein EDB85DRAFT_1948816, partial [Lactarius pseudohatsudake]
MGPLLGFSSSLSSVHTAETAAFPRHLFGCLGPTKLHCTVSSKYLLRRIGRCSKSGNLLPFVVASLHSAARDPCIIRAALSWGDDEATQAKHDCGRTSVATRTQLGHGGRKAHSAIKFLALLLSNGVGGVPPSRCLPWGHVRFTVSHLFSEQSTYGATPLLIKILVPVLPICIVSWAHHCGRRI